MTNEEARKYILANYFDGDEDTKAFVDGDGEHWVMKFAIEALEKQIPRKPTEKVQEGFDFEVAHCLVCSYCNAPIVNVWSKVEYKPKFCHYCGQALDWSE